MRNSAGDISQYLNKADNALDVETAVFSLLEAFDEFSKLNGSARCTEEFLRLQRYYQEVYINVAYRFIGNKDALKSLPDYIIPHKNFSTEGDPRKLYRALMRIKK